jgi:hypothetical protein
VDEVTPMIATSKKRADFLKEIWEIPHQSDRLQEE